MAVCYKSVRDYALIEALATFRRGWQDTAGGQSLLEVEAPVGLVLADIVEILNRLGLEPEKTREILGEELSTSVKEVTQ